METVTISKKEYQDLKQKAEIDADLLKQLMKSFKDVKQGRVKQVK